MFKKRSVLLKASEKNFDEAMQVSLKKRSEKDAQRVISLLDEKVQIQSNLLQIVEQHQQRLMKEVYKPLDLTLDGSCFQNEKFSDIPEPQIPSSSSNKKGNTLAQMKQAQAGNTQSSSLSSISSIEDEISSNLVLNTDSNENIKTTSTSTTTSVTVNAPLLKITTYDQSDSIGSQIQLSQKSSPKKRASLNSEPAIDPDEPTYCYCGQVSWGEMVACDGPDCEKEWFHLPCTELNSLPSNKWFCSDCKNKKS